jgi:MFS transporter, ACDE family, multidrug resistance protein
MDAASPPDQRRLLPLIVTITGMGVLGFAIIAPALPDLADELGVSRGAIGLVQGAIAVPGIFLAGYIGYLADRVGRRRVIRTSLLIFGIAGLASFFARSYWLLIAARLLQGLGTSGLLGMGVVVIGDVFTGYRRRWAMGINIAGLTAVTTLAPVIGGLLAEGGAFRPFLVFGVAFPVFVWARRLPDVTTGEEMSPALKHLAEALRQLRDRGRLSDFLGMLPMSFLTLGIFLGLGLTVLPLFLEAEFGLSVSRRGFVQSILAASSSVASVMSARVGARFRPARIITFALGLMVAGFVVVGTAPSLWVLPAGLMLLGAGSGSIFPLLQDHAASSGPDRYRGVLVGTWVTANRTGQVVGPSTGTAIAASIGERSTYLLGGLLMAVVAVSWRPARYAAQRLERSRSAGGPESTPSG